jgi:hypothetical protein
MKKLFALSVLVIGLTAATMPKEPIVTITGIEAAAKIPAKVKEAIAPKVLKLDERLQKIAVFHETYKKADEATRAKMHEDAQQIHEECMKLLEEITAQMTPEQKAAFITYLHEQLKASGVDPAHFRGPHGGDHDAAAHARRHGN